MADGDHELLEIFARTGTQAAFATLVERHVDLVYSVARRHVQSAALAEDVAQTVFSELARQAAEIDRTAPLVAWLHVVARRMAVDCVRREARRRAREQHAAELLAMNSDAPDWSAIKPLLDEAVEALPPRDRAAILLRFFESKSLRDIGAALGVSDDAAQKRVSRALDELRAFFVRRGVTVSAAGLMTTLSAHALEGAPAGLSAAIAGHAVVAATGAAATGAATAAAGGVEAAKFFAMTAVQKSALVGVFALLGGRGALSNPPRRAPGVGARRVAGGDHESQGLGAAAARRVGRDHRAVGQSRARD